MIFEAATRGLQRLGSGRRAVVELLPIAGFALAVGTLAAVLRGASFVSSFSFVPVGLDAGTGGGLAALAGQFGVRVPANSEAMSPLLYAEVLGTRTFLDRISDARIPRSGSQGDSVSVSELYGFTNPDDAKRRSETANFLRRSAVRAFVATRTSGSVTVTVSAPDPSAAKAIAEITLVNLEGFNRQVAVTRAAAERRFLEQRIEQTTIELSVAEDSLADFLRKNRQFSESPELVFERDRLQRAVQRRSDVLARLSVEVEDSRIREARDTPMITVIENPILPVKRSRRGQLAFGFFAFSLVATSGVAFRVVRLGTEAGPDTSVRG